MTTGMRLATYRKTKNLTQQQLGEQLNISAQAVSKWENDLAEPDIATLRKLATLYGVSINDLLGDDAVAPEQPAAESGAEKEAAPEPKVIIEKEIVYKDPPAPVLAVCEDCNRPIYKGNEIVRHTYGRASTVHITCTDCERKKKEKHDRMMRETAAHRRKLSFILGTLGFAAVAALLIALGGVPMIVPGIVIGLAAFTLISCLLFSNNFIGEMIASIAGFSIRMPGVIFSLDLDGIIWLLTVKLALWILGFLISAACFLLAISLGLALSIFVYPFAIYKNVKHPEDSDF